jgi:hypothetical protein
MASSDLSDRLIKAMIKGDGGKGVDTLGICCEEDCLEGDCQCPTLSFDCSSICDAVSCDEVEEEALWLDKEKGAPPPPKRKKNPSKKKKSKKKSKFACKRVRMAFNTKELADFFVSSEGGKVYNQNCFLDVDWAGMSHRAHFLKKVFTVDEMNELLRLLLSCPKKYWEKKPDKRGERRYLYTGHWKHMNYDTIYPAGKAGKLEVLQPILKDYLEKLGERATEILKLKRPEVFEALESSGFSLQDFGAFHLFMCPAGYSEMHQDTNDFIAFIFLINIEASSGGDGLHIGGCGVNFNMRVGDVLLLDSDVLWHGSTSYVGNEDITQVTNKDRLVGLFIVHRKFMRAKGMSWDKMKRETYQDRTIPKK